MRNIFFNRQSSKLGLLGSLVAVVAVALVLALVPQKTNIKTLAENCVNPPTTPTLNYWPITYDDVNTPLCHDFPAIDAAVYNPNGSPVYSQSEADWNNGLNLNAGQEGVALMYIHNGAANNLPGNQTMARNVKITTNTDTSVGSTHNIAVRFAGDNTNVVNKSFAVHTPANAHLEIVPNSGFMYDYEGNLVLDQQNLNLGNSTYTLGDLDACFEYSVFLTFRFKVVGPPAPTNTTLSITKQVRSLDRNTSFAPSVNVERNERVQYKAIVKNTGTTTATNVVFTDNGVAGIQIESGSVTLDGGPAQRSLPGILPLGDMTPGSERTIIYNARATNTDGTFVNTATAVANNAPSVSATATVIVTHVNPPAGVIAITKLVKNNNAGTSYADSVGAKTGEWTNFKVTVTNTGNSAVNNVKITDPIPSGLQYDSASVVTTGSVSFANNTLTVNFGTLAPGQSRTVEFATQVTRSTAGQICNIATASGDNVPSVTADACVNVTNPPVETRVLAVKKFVKNLSTGTAYSDDSVQARTGERVNFKISVTNNGNAVINNVRVTDAIPSGLQFDDSFTGDGAPSFTVPTLSVDFGSLAAGQTKTVEFAAKVLAVAPASICNVAKATGTGVAEVTDNACVTVYTTPKPGEPNIVQVKSAFNNTKNVDATTVNAARGDTITFTLKTTNNGTADAVNYVITDDLSGVLPLADLIDNGGATLNGNILSYPAITIKPGETVTKTFVVKVKSSLAPTLSYQIRNTYGNTVVINVPGNIIYQAPTTGAAATSAAVFAGLITIAAVAVRRGKDIMSFIFA